MKILSFIKDGLLIVLLAALIAVAIRFYGLEQQSRLAIQAYGKAGIDSADVIKQEQILLRQTLPDTIKNFNGTVTQITATTASLQHATDDVAALAVTLQGTSAAATNVLDTGQQALANATVQTSELAQAGREALARTYPSLQLLQTGLSSANTALTSANTLLASPQLTASLTSGAAVAANAAEITKQTAVISKDLRVEADKLVAPTPWYKRTFNYVFQTGTLVWDFKR
jgi:hypothetical protein